MSFLSLITFPCSSFITFLFSHWPGGLGKENNGEETSMAPGQLADTKQNSNAPAKKLGFGLIGLGKRTSVPSVFAEEDDENNVDKSIRPLVPIDYSNEELQAVQANSSTGANVAAAAEFAKRISVSNSKEEKADAEKDRNRRSSEGRPSDERREKLHDREKDKPKSENKKILDAKQLIDMIPRTKEELFAYDINWAIYDKVKSNSLTCIIFNLKLNSVLFFHLFSSFFFLYLAHAFFFCF
jgi:RNA-binding protein 25